MPQLRIRKLTPCECIKLMGFTKEDYEAMRQIGMSDSQIYHCAGDSIITTVVAMLVSTMLPISEKETKSIVENYVEVIKNEKKNN